MEISAFFTSSCWSRNLTRIARSMERAAFFARPIPVRHAESVLIPASVTAETEVSRRSFIKSALSCAEREGYKIFAIVGANKKSPRAQGIARRRVRSSVWSARIFPSSDLPFAKSPASEGTEAAASP